MLDIKFENANPLIANTRQVCNKYIQYVYIYILLHIYLYRQFMYMYIYIP